MGAWQLSNRVKRIRTTGFILANAPRASVALRKALEEHEKVCPLYRRSRIFINSDSFKFVDNFQAFLDCIITEDYLTLIPKATPYSLASSMLHTRRSWIYDKPLMKNVYNVGLVDCDYITYYPKVLKEDKESKDFTEDSAIYFMDIDGSKSEDVIFKDQFYYQLLTYLKGIKNNLRYPDMPIELMQGIDEEYQILQSKLQEFYRKCATHGRLYR